MLNVAALSKNKRRLSQQRTNQKYFTTTLQNIAVDTHVNRLPNILLFTAKYAIRPQMQIDLIISCFYCKILYLPLQIDMIEFCLNMLITH